MTCRQIRLEVDVIAQKLEHFRKKNSFTEGFSFQVSRSLVTKKKVHKMKVMIQNSAIKGNREFHLRPHKDLEMITLMLLCKIIDL